MERIRVYYRLAKPGIVYGNAIAAIAGFLLAANGRFDVWLFAAMLVGVSLIMASACVFNNYIDRDIDRLMTRTKKRALVDGTVSGRSALIYGTILGLLAIGILSFTNILTVALAVFGHFAYVVLYGIGKRKTVHGTVIGSISGAVPPVIGYTAVTDRLDTGALLLFLILVFWQMPHFYAIAMFRRDDYAAAKIPVLPLVKGMDHTKRQIMAYILAFIVASALLTVFGYAGYTYLAVMLLLGGYWLFKGWRGFRAENGYDWSRGMFRFSLVALLVFCSMISLEVLLP